MHEITQTKKDNDNNQPTTHNPPPKTVSRPSQREKSARSSPGPSNPFSHQPHSGLRLPSQRLAELIHNVRERVTSHSSAPTAAEPTVAPEPLKPSTDPPKTESNQCSDLWSNGLQLEQSRSL
ncbi:hypothetical protein RUM43_002471 [Polyplax serrata]|uniref:Uncharacterized protein n=1 Tax=Polyplax serrata TaxID=468196 RepID=A0AAN8S977_POLSC